MADFSQYKVVTVTGTRRGATQHQLNGLVSAWRKDRPDLMLNGSCKGVDAQASLEARDLGILFELYPAFEIGTATRADIKGAVMVHPIQPPLVRNKIMVNRCELVYALPGEMHEVQRSGTWHAIRYARSQDRPIVIIFPDGTRYEENI